MSVGKNIRARREELGWTQQDLADRMGYKTKSSINKIELGINDVSQSKVFDFARALNTSPAYIMGINDIPSSTEDVGKNIRARREELGWTQRELADRMGYKSVSTIAKIETCVNDVPRSKVFDFARVLNTSPTYIMGISDILPPVEENKSNKLSGTQKKLLDIIEDLSEEDAEQILQIVNLIVKGFRK